MSVCERGAHSPIPVSDREPWMRIQCRGALLRRVNYALSLRWRGMGNTSPGCCGQRFNFLIRAIFSCIHPKHLQGHTKTLAFSRREGFFLDFNRKLMEEGFLGDVELREILILPFLLLLSSEWWRCKSSSHHHLPIGGTFIRTCPPSIVQRGSQI